MGSRTDVLGPVSDATPPVSSSPDLLEDVDKWEDAIELDNSVKVSGQKNPINVSDDTLTSRGYRALASDRKSQHPVSSPVGDGEDPYCRTPGEAGTSRANLVTIDECSFFSFVDQKNDDLPPCTYKTPFNINRHVLLVIYCWIAITCANVYWGWAAGLREMLFKSGAYAWVCDDSSPSDSSIPLCPRQESLVADLLTYAFASHFVNSVFAGIVFDYGGPKITALLGLSLRLLGWLLLAFAGAATAAFYVLAFIIIAGSVDFVTLPLLHISTIYPRHKSLVVAALGACAITSTSIPLIMYRIWQSYFAESYIFQYLLTVYMGLGIGGSIILTIFVIPYRPFTILSKPQTPLDIHSGKFTPRIDVKSCRDVVEGTGLSSAETTSRSVCNPTPYTCAHEFSDCVGESAGGNTVNPKMRPYLPGEEISEGMNAGAPVMNASHKKNHPDKIEGFNCQDNEPEAHWNRRASSPEETRRGSLLAVPKPASEDIPVGSASYVSATEAAEVGSWLRRVCCRRKRDDVPKALQHLDSFGNPVDSFVTYMRNPTYYLIIPWACSTMFRALFITLSAKEQFGEAYEFWAISCVFRFVMTLILGFVGQIWGIFTILYIITAMGIVAYFMVLCNNIACDYIAVLCAYTFTSYSLSALYTYIGVTQPKQHFGKMVGLCSICAGLFQLISIPLFRMSKTTMNDSFMVADLIIIGVSVACVPLLIWMHILAKRAARKARTGVNEQVGGKSIILGRFTRYSSFLTRPDRACSTAASSVKPDVPIVERSSHTSVDNV